MKIPKKITPDYIKDSIVEIRYESKFPHEIAIGLFYQSLDDTYTYTNLELNNNQFNEGLGLQLGNRNRTLFYNKSIKIEFIPNSIILNSLNNYVSWEVYKLEIEKLLEQISKSNVISNYTRIGVRYISEFPELDLNDMIKFAFTFAMPDIKSDSYTFHSEFKLNDLRVILNLISRMRMDLIIPINQAVHTKVSRIDIDVIMENLNESTYQNVLPKIDIVHQKEKEIFFNLLKDEYLETLNPIY